MSQSIYYRDVSTFSKVRQTLTQEMFSKTDQNQEMWKHLYKNGQNQKILAMIDTPILAIFYEKKIVENVETSLYCQ